MHELNFSHSWCLVECLEIREQRCPTMIWLRKGIYFLTDQSTSRFKIQYDDAK